MLNMSSFVLTKPNAVVDMLSSRSWVGVTFPLSGWSRIGKQLQIIARNTFSHSRFRNPRSITRKRQWMKWNCLIASTRKGKKLNNSWRTVRGRTMMELLPTQSLSTLHMWPRFMIHFSIPVPTAVTCVWSSLFLETTFCLSSRPIATGHSDTCGQEYDSGHLQGA